MVSLSHMSSTLISKARLTVLQEVIAESYETTVYEILGRQLQMKADQYFPMALFIFL